MNRATRMGRPKGCRHCEVCHLTPDGDENLCPQKQEWDEALRILDELSDSDPNALVDFVVEVSIDPDELKALMDDRLLQDGDKPCLATEGELVLV